MSFVNTQQAYGKSVGTFATTSPWVDVRNPTSQDVNFQIGQFWINKNTTAVFFLNNFTISNSVVTANWIIITGVYTLLETLSDQANVPVQPSSSISAVPNNIQLFSTDGSITIASDTVNNRIDFSVSTVSLTWSVLTTSPATENDKGYFINGNALVNVPLPENSIVGDTIEVCAMSAFGWAITQQGTQRMRVGTLQTTLGAGGSISSLNVGDWVELVCNVASTGGFDNEWIVNVKQGNVTVV